MDVLLEALADKVFEQRNVAQRGDVIWGWDAGELGEACAIEGFAYVLLEENGKRRDWIRKGKEKLEGGKEDKHATRWANILRGMMWSGIHLGVVLW